MGRIVVETATSSPTAKSPFLSIVKPICRNAAWTLPGRIAERDTLPLIADDHGGHAQAAKFLVDREVLFFHGLFDILPVACLAGPFEIGLELGAEFAATRVELDERIGHRALGGDGSVAQAEAAGI